MLDLAYKNHMKNNFKVAENYYLKILKVQPDTLGAEINLKPGDRLLKINGKRVRDEIDYQFRITEENVSLEFEISGERILIDVEKEYDVDLGVEFEEFKVRSDRRLRSASLDAQDSPMKRQVDPKVTGSSLKSNMSLQIYKRLSD